MFVVISIAGPEAMSLVRVAVTYARNIPHFLLVWMHCKKLHEINHSEAIQEVMRMLFRMCCKFLRSTLNKLQPTQQL